MNKKSFLRGFGVGVLFVTLVLGISYLMRTSDSSIISRAKKLGMTFEKSDDKIVYSAAESTSGSAVSAENVNDNNNKTANNNNKQKNKKKVSSTPVPSPAATKKKNKDKEFENEKKNMEKDLIEEKKKITINSGDWAKKVADKLEDEGVIEDSEKFTEFMRQNGYSGKIRAGEYEFQKDEDFSEIAAMITNQKK